MRVLRLVSVLSVLSLFSVPVLGKCVNKRFYVERYGNDKQAFARLAADVNANGGGRIIFPADVIYEVSIEDDSNGGNGRFPQESSIVMNFRNCKKLSIDMNGSRIVIGKNHSTKYAVFFFYNCKSFCVKNGTLIGDSKVHDYSPVIYRGEEKKSSHQWGHGIDITGSKGTVRNMQISYMTGDGIRISSYKSKETVFHAKAEVDHCNISYCRRNGVTIGSTDGAVLSHTSIHHIGTHDGITGALPQAGIDLEYEDKAGGKGAVHISDCQIYECTTATITASNTSVPDPSAFCVADSRIEGSYFQITNLKVLGGAKKQVTGCSFINTPINCGDAVVKDCTFEMGAMIHYVHGTTFRNCMFSGQLTESDSKYGGCFAGNSYAPATFVKCDFRNIRGKNDNSVYQGFSGYAFKLCAVFEDCTFSNCSFVQGGAGAESNYSFQGCTLSNGCLIQNRSEGFVVFKHTKLDNVASYTNQKGQFSFDHCEIVQDDGSIQYPLLYFGNHRVKNSSIVNKVQITPDMKSRGIKAARIEEIK